MDNNWKVYNKAHEIFGSDHGKRLENISWRLFNSGPNGSTSTSASASNITSSGTEQPHQTAGNIENSGNMVNDRSLLVHPEPSQHPSQSYSAHNHNYSNESIPSSSTLNHSSNTGNVELFCYNCKRFHSDIWHKSTTQPVIILCSHCLAELAHTLVPLH